MYWRVLQCRIGRTESTLYLTARCIINVDQQKTFWAMIFEPLKTSANIAVSKIDLNKAVQLLEKAALRDIEVGDELEALRRERLISVVL